MDLHHANWDSLPWERVREGVEHKAFSGSGDTMAMNRLILGHEPRPHGHSHERMMHIVSGEIDFRGATNAQLPASPRVQDAAPRPRRTGARWSATSLC